MIPISNFVLSVVLNKNEDTDKNESNKNQDIASRYSYFRETQFFRNTNQ